MHPPIPTMAALVLPASAILAEAGVCPCDADVDNDGRVNIIDWACIQDCKSGDCSCCASSCDINCDGVVDDADAGTDVFTEISAWRCQFIGSPATSCCGACCDADAGVCTDDLWLSDCGGSNDVWSSGVRCSDVQCDPTPTGACCNLDFGTCDDELPQNACANSNLVWNQGLSCLEVECPVPPSGSCCNMANGQCRDDILAVNCADTDRVWTQSTACSAVTCQVPPQEPCPCNAEVNGASPLNVLDVLAILDCANDDCDQCLENCDIDCNGLVDYIDMGYAACQFRGKSNCCVEPSGACLGAQALPSCAITTRDGCELLEGHYVGTSTSCLNGVAIPSTSTWGAAIMALFITTAATLIVRDRARRQDVPSGSLAAIDR